MLVLAKGKTDAARAWVYVRDDAPFGGPGPPAAQFRYSRDRSSDHPVAHLQSFTGILQADAYAGYPPCAAALGVCHESLNRSMGERVRGDLHVQTVNSRHSRWKDFLRPRRGVATRYLDNYLSWFHLAGFAPGANDRACLAAAVTR